ncbi:hypothetical protein [Ornithinimicrobium cerasi]|uniref:Uncharacterized protein n=1 Tax=Ornithinimicrobium cerasi TaxID=2248773 RepID=A0A285VMK1_9MICO|nr:hypothetical protein [Ornithinimicrobium cerasi]SOC55315.1 hypothetical protein SAMN05421879_10521 [Ornithinimicrobium cerasi]
MHTHPEGDVDRFDSVRRLSAAYQFRQWAGHLPYGYIFAITTSLFLFGASLADDSGILSVLSIALALFSYVLMREGRVESILLPLRTLTFTTLLARLFLRFAAMLGVSLVVLPAWVILPAANALSSTERLGELPLSISMAVANLVAARSFAHFVWDYVTSLSEKWAKFGTGSSRWFRRVLFAGLSSMAGAYANLCLTLMPWQGLPRQRGKPVHLNPRKFLAVASWMMLYVVAVGGATYLFITAMMPTEMLLPPLPASSGVGFTVAIATAACLAFALDVLSDLRRLTSTSRPRALAHLLGVVLLVWVASDTLGAMAVARADGLIGGPVVGSIRVHDVLLGAVLGGLAALLFDVSHALLAIFNRLSLPGRPPERQEREEIEESRRGDVSHEPGKFELTFRSPAGEMYSQHVTFVPALKGSLDDLMALTLRNLHASNPEAELRVYSEWGSDTPQFGVTGDWPVLRWVGRIEVQNASLRDRLLVRQVVHRSVRVSVPRRWRWTEWPAAGKRLAEQLANVEFTPKARLPYIAVRRAFDLSAVADDGRICWLSFSVGQRLPCASRYSFDSRVLHPIGKSLEFRWFAAPGDSSDPVEVHANHAPIGSAFVSRSLPPDKSCRLETSDAEQWN